MQMQRDDRHTAECEKWEELERVCRCKGDIRHTAECGNWKELERVCRCKGMSEKLLVWKQEGIRKAMQIQSGYQTYC
jgi:hypothetical protein